MGDTWQGVVEKQWWFCGKWWKTVVDKTTYGFLVAEKRKLRSWRAMYLSGRSVSSSCRIIGKSILAYRTSIKRLLFWNPEVVDERLEFRMGSV